MFWGVHVSRIEEQVKDVAARGAKGVMVGVSAPRVSVSNVCVNERVMV